MESGKLTNFILNKDLDLNPIKNLIRNYNEVKYFDTFIELKRAEIKHLGLRKIRKLLPLAIIS